MSLKKLYAYQMGLDCGRNGPNEKNCHFSIFSRREYTDAWEKGKADAEKGDVLDRHGNVSKGDKNDGNETEMKASI